MSKIILCGAKSAKKGALADAWCSMNRGYIHVREVSRDVVELDTKKATHPVQPDAKLVEALFQIQNKRESELGNNLFITEAGPDYIVPTFLESRDQAKEISQSTYVKECFARYKGSLVVLVSPLENTTYEGIRLVEWREAQRKFTDALHQVLRIYRIPYMYLREGELRLRLEQLEKAVKGKLPIPGEVDKFIDPLCLSFYLDTRKVDKSPSSSLPLHKQGTEASVRTFEISKSEVALSNPTMDNFDTNRMVERYGEENFILIKFIWLPPIIVKHALKKGVEVNGEIYHFIGCSNGGLKKGKCYLMRGSVAYVEKILSECGSFSEIKMVSKRMKRISQLFSVGKDSGVPVTNEKVISDIERGGENFTDGCGFVGVRLAEKLAIGAKILQRDPPENRVPSVFQIRFQGCKGIVIQDREIGPDALHVRKSMEKFKPSTNPFPNVWVCAHSRPYAYGCLNKQIIVLLSGRGIPDEVFLKKQEKYIIDLENMLIDPESAITMLNWRNRSDIARMIAACSSIEEFKQDRVMIPLKEVKRKLIYKLEKLSIPIWDSRTMFGVCDPSNDLEYGQCFIRITTKGVPETLSQGTRIIVVKNPCYLLGDIRVLTTVDNRKLDHLVDCIVFPVKGKRPHSSEIAGSDLDGDEYYVFWDQDLIPQCPAKPYEFPSVDAPPSTLEITREMMIDYFADYRDRMGQISKFFDYWAMREGPNCTKCQRLGALFSRSVDSAKTGDRLRIDRDLYIPRDNGENPPPDLDRPKRVWEKMLEIALDCEEKLKNKIVQEALNSNQSLQTLSEEFVQSQLDNSKFGMSEYKLFQLVHNWCYAQDIPEIKKLEKLCEFSDRINFGIFTLEQRKRAIEAGIPVDIVMNALNKSKIMNTEFLRTFSLTVPVCGWKFYFRASSAGFKWQHLLRAFTGFSEAMLILQLPDDISVALHFIGKLKEGINNIRPRAITAYLYSPHFGYKLRHVITSKYCVDLSDILQVYIPNYERRDHSNNKPEHNANNLHQRGNSFFWLGKQNEDICAYDRFSINLTRFQRNIHRVDKHPLITKKIINSIEVFVKSELEENMDYFDILDSDNSGELFPTDSVSYDNLEELSSDEEDMEDEAVFPNTEPFEKLDPKQGMVDLSEFAERGDCLRFSRIISSLNNEMIKIISQSKLLHQVLALLTTLVVKFSHKNSSERLTEYLRTILTSPYIKFQTPKDFLQLYSSLNKLHLDSLTREHLKTFSFKLESTAQYMECVSHFEWWSFIPSFASCQVLNKLYRMNVEILSQQPEATDSISFTVPCSIQELATLKDMPPCSIDEAQLEHYKCYYSYLMLKHLLSESPGPVEFRKNGDTENSICMLKATNPRDARRNVELDECSEGEGEPGQEVVAKEEKTKQESQTFKVYFYRMHKLSFNKFKDASFVKIRHLAKPDSNHSQKPIALGRIARVFMKPGDNGILVDIHEPVPKSIKRSAQLEKGYWSLTLLGNVTSFQRSCKALKHLHNSPHITPILISPEAFPPEIENQEREDINAHDMSEMKVANPCISDNPNIKRDNCKVCEKRQRFNPSQEAAICAALNQSLTLIHGPPGTGKTCVASEIVHRMCHLKELNGDSEDKKTKILVAAETNNAVDNLARKLLDMNIHVVRVGSQVSADICEYTLGRMVRKRLEELGREAKGHFLPLKLKKEVLQSADVIATTCTGAGDTDLSDIKFSFVLIDEATQAIEPVSLIPIAKFCQKLVLIGDPMQLAPTISSSHQEQECGDLPALRNLEETLFHRLSKATKPSFLEEQYRMHPYIARFPSRKFYDGKLKSGVTEGERTPPDLKFMYKDRPVVFINVKSIESSTYSSHRNENEAEVVLKVIMQLKAVTSEDNIAVLTPYAGQSKCIRERLESESIKVEVCTVDGFQGKEKDFIVFSTVRSSEKGRLGFTDSECRINVLLTRAKIALVGVGNYETISKCEVWKDWLEDNDVITEDEFNEYIASDIKRVERSDRQPRRERNQHFRDRNTNHPYSPNSRKRYKSSDSTIYGYYSKSRKEASTSDGPSNPKVYVSNSSKRRASTGKNGRGDNGDSKVDRYAKRGRVDNRDYYGRKN